MITGSIIISYYRGIFIRHHNLINIQLHLINSVTTSLKIGTYAFAARKVIDSKLHPLNNWPLCDRECISAMTRYK